MEMKCNVCKHSKVSTSPPIPGLNHGLEKTKDRKPRNSSEDQKDREQNQVVDLYKMSEWFAKARPAQGWDRYKGGDGNKN